MSSEDYRWHYDYARLALDTGFSFQTYRTKSLDRIIGPIHVDNVIRDRDVATIEKYIPAVVEFSLDNDQTSVLDPTFVKIFRISQLSVQYLLFCKKYLDNSVVLIKQEYQKSNEENKNIKRQVDELRQEASNYKKQIKELKTALSSQTANSQNTGIFQCQECPKAFSTEEYLLAHIKRRHESLGILVAPSNTSFQTETDKLQLEIKQLKEQLNNTERFVGHNEFMTVRECPSKHNTEKNPFVSELQEKFEHLKTHVDSELKILQTQKFEKEKYEKWFETFLSNKLNIVNNNGCDKPITATTGTQGEIVTNNCSTQTEPLVPASPVHEKIQSGDSENVLPGIISDGDYKNRIRKELHNTKELQEKMQLETQNRFQKFEELLEEKVTGSIEKLETQMQTFLVKINDIEEKRANKTRCNTSVESLNDLTQKPQRRSRKEVIPSRPKSTPPFFGIIKSSEQNNDDNTSPIIKIAKPPVTASRSRNTAIIKKSPSSSSESEEETESDESETDDDNHQVVIQKPVVKISATSTLGQRSLTSLKEAAFTPEVLAQLQIEIEKVMQKRLQEIGVNPKSKSIPVRPYQRALGIVSHQASVIRKNVSNYMEIRRQILKDVDNKVAKSSKSSKLKSLLNNFRERPKNSKVPQKPQALQVKNTVMENAKAILDLSESEVDSPQTNKSNKTFILNKPMGSLKNIQNVALDSTDESIQAPVIQNTATVKGFGNLKPVRPTLNDTKGVLKNNPVVGYQPKKKVIFDLDSADIKENMKSVAQSKTVEGGSTTSIASSVFDGSKASLVETQAQPEKKKREVYDSSDWELSEISTN